MIARCLPVAEFSLRLLAGTMTCVFAATTGIVQKGLERVIAYSTWSQLGYVNFACSILNYSLGLR